MTLRLRLRLRLLVRVEAKALRKIFTRILSLNPRLRLLLLRLLWRIDWVDWFDRRHQGSAFCKATPLV